MRKHPSALRRCIGHRVRRAAAQKVRFEGDQEESINRVGVEFDNGARFLFGVRGDGSVGVHGGWLEEDLALPALDDFWTEDIAGIVGGTLEAVAFGSDRVELIVSTGVLKIENDCDELALCVGKRSKSLAGSS